RHGALGAAPQAALARHHHLRQGRTARGLAPEGRVPVSLRIIPIMSRIAYVNGKYLPHRTAAVHIEDRGYQFADGVYEVVPVQKGKLIDEDLHLDRLE